jgi:hypothetical protein
MKREDLADQLCFSIIGVRQLNTISQEAAQQLLSAAQRFMRFWPPPTDVWAKLPEGTQDELNALAETFIKAVQKALGIEEPS